MDWKERERQRFARGEYQLVPWADQAWWQALIDPDAGGPLADHFAHASTEDGGKVAFTENPARGELDVQTRMKPGRYLARFCKGLTPDAVRDWAGAFAATYEENVLHFATTPDEIERVYTHGPSSCMSGRAIAYAGRIHPARVYGAGDLAVAYLVRAGDVTARCLVWPSEKIRTRVYGDEGRIRPLLDAAGFNAERTLEGARLLRIPARGYEGAFVCPYIDWNDKVRDDGKHLIIDGDGEIYCQRTDGISEPTVESEGCSECEERSESVSYCEVADASLCEACLSDLVAHCEQCGERVMRADRSMVQSGEEVCAVCLAESFRLCQECDEQVPLVAFVGRSGRVSTCADCVAADATEGEANVA